MPNFLNIKRDYKNIDVYRKLLNANDAVYTLSLCTLAEYAIKNMKAKEFLEFSRKLEYIIDKQNWVNIFIYVNMDENLNFKDSEKSGTLQYTSDYHKNLARVSRLLEGLDRVSIGEYFVHDTILKFDKNNEKSFGYTNIAKAISERYRSGIIKADKRAEKAIAILKTKSREK